MPAIAAIIHNIAARFHKGGVDQTPERWEPQPAPGEALWLPPLTPHSVENVGQSELCLIAVELKHG